MYQDELYLKKAQSDTDKIEYTQSYSLLFDDDDWDDDDDDDDDD